MTAADSAAVVEVGALVRAAASRLASAGVPSPDHDARVLAADVLGVEPSALRPGLGVSPAQAQRIDALVARRAERVPLQHLTGRAYFRHLTLAVGPGVFVPRPETELVAQAAIDGVQRWIDLGVPRPVLVDLCTGSGAIAAAVATEVPSARVHAVELSPEAHVWAERNLAGLGVDLRLGDAATAFSDLVGDAHVVVSNPPYIPPDGVVRDPEVRDHDPALALWGGGADGLDVVRAVVARAAVLLVDDGRLVVEHADVQGAAVVSLVAACGAFDDVADHVDLNGRDRFVTARRVPAS